MEPVTMSVQSPSLERTADESLLALRAAAELAARPVRFVAFWIATLLPLTYVPMLAMGVPATHGTTFAGLICLNAVAFVAGHGHNRPD
ncbi:hypothetical protein [Haloplanus sp. C73]|uniref:hypothetical protein n=1 Tax=Haloplanus sp. C73 TaxID=3421641 RepID=UPI003EBD438E